MGSRCWEGVVLCREEQHPGVVGGRHWTRSQGIRRLPETKQTAGSHGGHLMEVCSEAQRPVSPPGRGRRLCYHLRSRHLTEPRWSSGTSVRRGEAGLEATLVWESSQELRGISKKSGSPHCSRRGSSGGMRLAVQRSGLLFMNLTGKKDK